MPRHTDPAPRRTRRHWPLVVAAGLAAAAAGGHGCRRSAPEPGGATTSKARDARKHAETFALDAVKGAVAAEVDAHPELAKQKSWVAGMVSHLTAPEKPPAPAPVPPPHPPQPPQPPKAPTRVVVQRAAPARPGGAVVVRERVTSDIPYPTEAEAEAATMDAAGDRIAQKLRELDPPVEYRPSAAVVKNDYLRPDSRSVRPPTDRERELIQSSGYHPDRLYVEYTVEMTADQVRELRIQGRVGAALRAFGAVVAAALAGFLFLRLDEWSKGYLTSWLAVVAVAIVGGAGVALALV